MELTLHNTAIDNNLDQAVTALNLFCGSITRIPDTVRRLALIDVDFDEQLLSHLPTNLTTLTIQFKKHHTNNQWLTRLTNLQYCVLYNAEIQVLDRVQYMKCYNYKKYEAPENDRCCRSVG